MSTGYDPNDARRRDLNHDGRVDADERRIDEQRHDSHVHGLARTDEVVRHDRVVPAADPTVTKEIRRDAYERGRADERSLHKRNPLLTLLIALAAVFGLAVIGLYIYNGGSFTETGRDLDQATTRAAQEAEQVGREVADETGEALQDGGRRVEQVGEAAPAGQAEPANR